MRVALAVVLSLVLTGTAHAATVQFREECGLGPDAECDRFVAYSGESGEANDATITATGRRSVQIVDNGATVKVLPDVAVSARVHSSKATCQSISAHEADCTTGIDLDFVRADTGDGDDSLVLSGTVPFDANGGPGNDVVSGGEGPDRIHGGGGLDVLSGNGGPDEIFDDDEEAGVFDADQIDGGQGRDRVNYEFRATALDVDLMTGIGGRAGEGDAVQNVEDVTGGAAADSLSGDDGPNRFEGREGRDAIACLGGRDSVELSNGDGRDSLQDCEVGVHTLNTLDDVLTASLEPTKYRKRAGFLPVRCGRHVSERRCKGSISVRRFVAASASRARAAKKVGFSIKRGKRAKLRLNFTRRAARAIRGDGLDVIVTLRVTNFSYRADYRTLFKR